MVQHIRKKHPEFAQLPNTIHAPLATAVISSTPAVLTTDSTTGETVVVRIEDVKSRQQRKTNGTEALWL